jgi:hypothetical protein
MEEREQSYYDVHGVSDAIDETPEFLEKAARTERARKDIQE